MSNLIVQTDIAELLNKLDGRFDKLDLKLDKIDERLNKLEVGKAELKVKVESIERTVNKLKNNQKVLTVDVALKGTKSLIIPLLVAVRTSILTLVIGAIPIS